MTSDGIRNLFIDQWYLLIVKFRTTVEIFTRLLYIAFLAPKTSPTPIRTLLWTQRFWLFLKLSSLIAISRGFSRTQRLIHEHPCPNLSAYTRTSQNTPPDSVIREPACTWTFAVYLPKKHENDIIHGVGRKTPSDLSWLRYNSAKHWSTASFDGIVVHFVIWCIW